SALRQMSKRRRFVTRLIFWLFITLSSFGIYKARRTLDLGGAFFLIFWCLPLWYLCFIRPLLHSILFWRTPLQILLLRPFEFPKSQQRTRRFAREYLRYLGHTYTLSDPEVKPRPLFLESVQVLLVLSSLWLYRAFRPYYKVKTDEDVTGLKEFINGRFARNIAWVLSWDKLFKISCTVQTWKRTVQHLINTAQLIVVDLSHAGEGLRWELDEARFYQTTGKLVFICYEDYLDAARTFLESNGWLGGPELELFVYADNGIARRHQELMRTLVSVAASSLKANDSAGPRA